MGRLTSYDGACCPSGQAGSKPIGPQAPLISISAYLPFFRECTHVAEGLPVFTQALMPLPMDAVYGDRANVGDGPDG